MWMKLGMFDWCINNLFTNFNVKYVMKYSMKFNSFNQGLKNFRKKGCLDGTTCKSLADAIFYSNIFFSTQA